jgi:excisionase family DNA binding protein
VPNTVPNGGRLENAYDTAALLNTHVETLRRLARVGKVPSYKVGRSLRFDPEEVRAALRVDVAQPARARKTSSATPDFDALDSNATLHRPAHAPARARPKTKASRNAKNDEALGELAPPFLDFCAPRCKTEAE